MQFITTFTTSIYVTLMDVILLIIIIYLIK